MGFANRPRFLTRSAATRNHPKSHSTVGDDWQRSRHRVVVDLLCASEVPLDRAFVSDRKHCLAALPVLDAAPLWNCRGGLGHGFRPWIKDCHAYARIGAMGASAVGLGSH